MSGGDIRAHRVGICQCSYCVAGKEPLGPAWLNTRVNYVPSRYIADPSLYKVVYEVDLDTWLPDRPYSIDDDVWLP